MCRSETLCSRHQKILNIFFININQYFVIKKIQTQEALVTDFLIRVVDVSVNHIPKILSVSFLFPSCLANLEETLDLSLSLQDYHLQEVTLYAKQTGNLRPTLSTQDIMALQRQEERHRQQSKQSVFGFMFKKSKETSLSTDSLAGRSASPARSDETARSASPLQPPARPQRKKRPAPKPPTDAVPSVQDASGNSGKDKTVINHSRNSSDSSGYHEASVLSDNLADSAARLPETLPRRSKAPAMSDTTRKLAQTSQSSKSLGNLTATGATLSRGISNTSLSSTGEILFSIRFHIVIHMYI